MFFNDCGDLRDFKGSYSEYASKSLKGEEISYEEALGILKDKTPHHLLPLLQAAYEVRHHYWGQDVNIHILNNVQNGLCSEDCSYCPQSSKSKAPIEEYPMKNEEEILLEAKRAYESGAFRYCMVFSGKGPSLKRTEKIAGIIRKIKSLYPIEVCVSAGLATEDHMGILKESGCDRINHNINTSPRNYDLICSTHTYQDRIDTLRAAKRVGLEVCSGLIVGMGETPEELVDLAKTLRRFEVKSIPINFLLPIEGNEASMQDLDPVYCLRVLCLFRFLNPSAEIRVAAGREFNFRSLEVMSLYPANSLFLDGYLNVKGASSIKTLRMILDAGFKIRSDFKVEEVLEKYEQEKGFSGTRGTIGLEHLKSKKELRLGNYELH